MTQILEQQVYGEKTQHPALLIVHGLFGSGRNWRAIAKRFSSDRQVIVVDMRNHGDSFWSDEHSYADLADDLVQVLAQIDGQVDVLGHSMGGKTAMFLALRNPPNMNRLLVADIAPIAYTHLQIANIEIMRKLNIASITRRSEVEKAITEQSGDPATSAFLAQSLVIAEAGNRWKLNLDALAANMADIVGFPAVSGVFNNEVVFIKGGNSDYVLPEHAGIINQLFPNNSIQSIAGAGHWVHAEAPREFIMAVQGFLNSGA